MSLNHSAPLHSAVLLFEKAPLRTRMVSVRAGLRDAWKRRGGAVSEALCDMARVACRETLSMQIMRCQRAEMYRVD